MYGGRQTFRLNTAVPTKLNIVATRFEQILIAFASRRSLLLLLNFASQVRVLELPWVDVIDHLNHSRDDLELTSHVQMSTVNFCRTVVVIHALKRFGEAPLCNAFAGELRPLRQAADVADCPLIEELAADIFMGSFITNYGRRDSTSDSGRG